MRALLPMLALYGCVAAPAGIAAAEPYAPQVGQKHPDFRLPSIDGGEPVSLSQWRGRKVLLIQFASW